MAIEYKSHWLQKQNVTSGKFPARVNIEVENSILLIDIESAGSSRASEKKRVILLTYILKQLATLDPAIKVIGYRYGNLKKPGLAGSKFRSAGKAIFVTDLEKILKVHKEGGWYRFRVWVYSGKESFHFSDLISYLKLHETNRQIKRSLIDSIWPEELKVIRELPAEYHMHEDQSTPEVAGVEEGAWREILSHKQRERRSLRKERLQLMLARYDKVFCECCGTLSPTPDLPCAIFEVHHIVPLHTFSGIQNTTLDDLSVLCANCHRLIHSQMKEIGEHVTPEILRQSFFKFKKD